MVNSQEQQLGHLAEQQEAALEKSLRTYTSDDFECSYLYKPASPGHEQAPPLLLVHPVTTSLPLLRPVHMIA